MELDALKKWYEDVCRHAEWFKNTDLQWALDRKEKRRTDNEEATNEADKILATYTDILDKRAFLLELIQQRDPDFDGILDKKEGE